MSIKPNKVEFISSAKMPNKFGAFDIHMFDYKGEEVIALTHGEISNVDNVMLRIHSECLTGDGFFSSRCDCGPQLETAFEKIVENGSGMIIYLRQEGRGIGLTEKIKAYALQDQGADTYDANIQLGHQADAREYGMLEGVFTHFGVKQVELLTNNPLKIKAVQDAGAILTERIEHKAGLTQDNQDYIETKLSKFGHL